jgi:hypothetical protein
VHFQNIIEFTNPTISLQSQSLPLTPEGCLALLQRRSAKLPELEPSTFNTDLFGLDQSTPEAPDFGNVHMDAYLDPTILGECGAQQC